MKCHPILVSFPFILAFTFSAAALTRYVNVGNNSPFYPYLSWTTAASNIQSAIDIAFPGDLILVTNGIYQMGGRVVEGSLSNRVAVTKAVTVRSVNGPSATVIKGHQVPGTVCGNAAVRCVYLTTGAFLSGFTLTNGATREAGSWNGLDREGGGGGLWCQSNNATASNCVLTGNAAYYHGGGAYNGTLINCTLSMNRASTVGVATGGGVQGSVMTNCILADNWSGYDGGGADHAVLANCELTGNWAQYDGGGATHSILDNCAIVTNQSSGYGGGVTWCTLSRCLLRDNKAIYGGGAFYSTLNNCILMGNSAHTPGKGGGAYEGELNNCTIVRNSAPLEGGGTYRGKLRNCIVYYNSALQLNDVFLSVDASCLDYNDGTIFNITNAPRFVDLEGGDLRLQPDSPCINAGSNAYVTNSTDYSGQPRIRGGTVDIGAYEFQTPGSVLSYAFLQRYGLPLDGSVDFLDTDGDGMNNWQEWHAGTSPTDAQSALRMLTPFSIFPTYAVGWQSVDGKRYFIERSTNLNSQPAFSVVATNFSASGKMIWYSDPTAGSGPCFYRIGVE